MLRILALSFVLVGSFVFADPPPIKPSPSAPAAIPAPRIVIGQCHVEEPFIAITFDDGPHASQTPRLLKMLKERGLHATFFVVGQCVAENPEIARQIVAEGHEIANHSWSHPSLSGLPEGAVRDQLQRTHDVIKQETGITPVLMRPPYGNFTPNQRAWAHLTWGYTCVLWSVDTNDWKHRNAAKTQSAILSETRPGSIILCHDIHKTTVDAMPAALDGLLAKGFKFVTVSELLKLHKDKPAVAKAAPAPTLTAKGAVGAATTLEELKKPASVPAQSAKP